MVLSVLVPLTVLMVTARLLGLLCHRLNQPAVIGEIIGGVLLGPSALGRFSPAAQQIVLPPDGAPILNGIAQLGVILYMLLVGLELDLDALRSRVRSTLAISGAGIIVPFTLGGALALVLYGAHAPVGVGFGPFALFVAVSMSITAFPVLARILDDRGIQGTGLGMVALTCAAIDDVMAWCLLAIIIGAIRTTPSAALTTVALTAVYVAAMLTAARAFAVRTTARLDRGSNAGSGGMTVMLTAALLSAAIAEVIGVHAIFGAFLVGAIVPHDSRVARQAHERLADVVRVLLLPAFFALTGLRTQIGLLQTADDWMLCATIIAVATAGKFGGVALTASLTGLPWRDSAALGILMNTRGLVELIVLNIGLDLGILTPQLFTMLVIMAIVTTMMTSPVLDRLLRLDAHPARAALRGSVRIAADHVT